MTLVANARMYAVTPDASAAWNALFARVAARAGVPLDVVAHPYPAPLATLWSRPDLGGVFMCGRPWLRASPRPKPVVAPLPSPSRYGGRPVYVTDLVVRADAPFRTLEDTFGHRLGYTLEESQSGYNALRHHLLAYRTPSRPTLYAASVGPLDTPRRVVDALLEGRIDVGPLDGYAFDLMRRTQPDLARRLRVVATTEFAPIPFLVASADCPDATVARLRDAFLAAGERDADLCERLLLTGFVPVPEAAYAQLGDQDAAARAARYDVPA